MDTLAQRGNYSFEKRQREADRQDRAREKEARRQERREAGDDDGPTVDEGALMAEYGRLAERHAAGEVNEEGFLARKREIFEELGLEVD